MQNPRPTTLALAHQGTRRHHGPHAPRRLAATMTLALGCLGEPAAPPTITTEPATIAVTPPGVALGSMLERVIPVMGGTVVSTDGRLTVDVPSGALSGPQTLSILPISAGPEGVGAAYRLGPEGMTFTAPVTLTFRYEEEELAGSQARALRIAYQDGEGRWNVVKKYSIDEQARTVSIQTTHFSDWELFTGYKLSPSTAITAPGKFVALQVKYCIADDQGSDELAALVSTCAPSSSFKADEWAVNAVRGGSAALGTVAAAPVVGTAQYQAPLQPPMVNPVAVSASVVDPSNMKTVLASTIWIDEHPPLRGEIASLQTNLFNPQDFYTTSALVSFSWNFDQEQYEVAQGTFKAEHHQKNPGGAPCEIHTSLSGNIGLQDGAILIQDSVYFATGRTSGLFSGTTSCTSNGGVQPLTLNDSAVWWPAPMGTGFSMKPNGEFAENLSGVSAYGARVNVVWSLRPAR